MKRLIALLSILLLCGCVYEVPLIEEATLPVDSAVNGSWQKIPEEGKSTDPDDRMVILPFSAKEYMVAVSPSDDAMYYRAYRIQVGDLHLMQLEILTLEPTDPDRYVVCRYALKNDVLMVETLNEKVVSDDIKDSSVLREALLANRDNPDLFKEEGRYRRIEE